MAVSPMGGCWGTWSWLPRLPLQQWAADHLREGSPVLVVPKKYSRLSPVLLIIPLAMHRLGFLAPGPYPCPRDKVTLPGSPSSLRAGINGILSCRGSLCESPVHLFFFNVFSFFFFLNVHRKQQPTMM